MPHPLAVEQLEAREVPAAAFDTLPIFPTADQAILDNARAVVALGAAQGRRSDAFLKIGDSNTATPDYLAPLASPAYDVFGSGLVAYGSNLVATLDAFRTPLGAGTNSFDRPSGIARNGGYLPELLPRLQGELDATRTTLAVVMIGTNDLGIYGDPVRFAGNLRTLVHTLTSQGVLPIMSTIPNNYQLGGVSLPGVRVFNQIIADIADQYDVPLWNFWRQLEALPFTGISGDAIHLNVSPRGGGSFAGGDLAYAQNVRNLQVLQLLDWFHTQVATPPQYVAPLDWTPLTTGHPVYAVGRDAGQGPVVEVVDADTGARLNRFNVFDPYFNGGVRVAVADVTGDGIPDVVAVPGVGGGPVVRVFSGTDGTLVANFFAFEGTFRNGLNVSAGDLDGDGVAEIVVGAGNGGAPAVAVFHGGDFREVNRFFAFESSFRGGVSVAVAGARIVAGAGVGGGPVVKLFTPDAQLASAFLVYADTVRSGVTVAAGDLDGDGLPELAVAPAAGNPTSR